jgi:DNA gyrase subunit A
MKLHDDRGSLVGGIVVEDNDEVLAIKASSQVTRTAASDVPVTGRDTMGVRFVGVSDDDQVVAIARNIERDEEEADTSDASTGLETTEPPEFSR